VEEGPHTWPQKRGGSTREYRDNAADAQASAPQRLPSASQSYVLPADSLPGQEGAKKTTVSLTAVLSCATDSIPPCNASEALVGNRQCLSAALLEKLWAAAGHKGTLQFTTDIQSCWNLSWSSGTAQSIASYLVLHPPLFPTSHLPTVKRCHIH